MGLSVANLISSTGAMILPFLEHDSLNKAGMDALKRMLCIDSDALYRHLMTVSGKDIPQCCWESEAPSEEEAESNTQASLELGKLERAAHALLDFGDSLPEQTLE
jgi:hypothetical protein